MAAIGLAVGLLGILLGSLILSGHSAFFQTKVPLQVYVDPQAVDAGDVGGGNYRKLARDAFRALLPGDMSRTEQRAHQAIMSPGAPPRPRARVMAAQPRSASGRERV